MLRRHRPGPWRCLLALALLTAVHHPAPAADVRPQRIVSLNVCLDPLVLALVERERIAALTILAKDPSLSTISGRVAGIPLVRGEAEEVLALDPDLVLAGEFAAVSTVELLRRVGRRVVVVPLANSIGDVAATIRTVAAAVGNQQAGEAMAVDLERRLATVPVAGRRPSALVVHVNGLVSSGGTLLDEALERAGFRNAADDHRLGRGGRLDLEAIVAHPPDLVVLAQDRTAFRTVVADNVRHPAMTDLLERHPSVVLAMSTWLCGTPALADAVADLAAMRRQMTDGMR